MVFQSLGVGRTSCCAAALLCLMFAQASRATDTGCGTGGNCFTAHPTLGCSNVDCCRAVCGADPFCCETEWDNFCVGGAFQLCSSCGFSDQGSCLQVQGTGSCEDAICCKAVCTVDPFCCHNHWDEFCVDGAIDLCTTCGDSGAGSCFDDNNTPSCNDAECCATVCGIDPYCCETAWDIICQQEAFELCTPCGDAGAGSCFVVHFSPSCDNEDCCATVCLIDPVCCSGIWDGLCVDQAFDFCDACGDPGLQSCTVASDFPACNDATCCSAVCAIDPFCCEEWWDFACVAQAETMCYTCGGSATGSCFSGQADPYCDDTQCCETVCACDPYCCETAWDGFCAGTGFVEGCGAQVLCVGPDCPQDCVTSETFAPPADGKVDGADLAVLLGDWGNCPGCCSDTVTSASFAPPPDGKTDGADLAVLLGAWGDPGCAD